MLKMNSPSFQLLLKSTSSMSLDERFTMVLQNQLAPLTDIRDTVSQHMAASASLKNQRLVQQMANRPSVLAALQNTLPQSVKQHQFKGSIKARLGRHVLRGRQHDMSRFWGRSRGSGALNRGALPHRLTNGSPIVEQHESYISRGGHSQRRGGRGALRGKGSGMLFLGCGSDERSIRLDCHRRPTREELDAQLDEYMSMSKSQLDAQLNAYMAEVDYEDLL